LKFQGAGRPYSEFILINLIFRGLPVHIRDLRKYELRPAHCS
jgi:hypothetical protein